MYLCSSGSDWLRQILTNGSNTQPDNIAILHLVQIEVTKFSSVV
eukprot:SAG11_NODE_40406_length_201_cov_26.495146_1_plen_43_part_10